MVCDMWSGLIMSSSVVSFRFAPRRFASPRSLLDRLQNWKKSHDWHTKRQNELLLRFG